MFQTKSLAVVVIKDHRMQIFRNEDFQDMFPICLHSVSLTGNSNDHDENFERVHIIAAPTGWQLLPEI